MGKYVLKRLLALIPTILIIVFVVYFIMELTPSDPGTLILGQNASAEAIAAKNAELGYNDPFFVRYFKYILNLCKGDLGVSWTNNKPVFDLVMARFPVTIILAAGATLIGVVFGVLLGVLAAVKQYSGWDIAGTSLAMILASFPAFWIGMMFIILFSLKLGWLPSYGTDSFKSYILPWFTTACGFVASQLRMTRTSMLECIRMDYIRTARAKGREGTNCDLPSCSEKCTSSGNYDYGHEFRSNAGRHGYGRDSIYSKWSRNFIASFHSKQRHSGCCRCYCNYCRLLYTGYAGG